jgi:hypothetical protein
MEQLLADGAASLTPEARQQLEADRAELQAAAERACWDGFLDWTLAQRDSSKPHRAADCAACRLLRELWGLRKGADRRRLFGVLVKELWADVAPCSGVRQELEADLCDEERVYLLRLALQSHLVEGVEALVITGEALSAEGLSQLRQLIAGSMEIEDGARRAELRETADRERHERQLVESYGFTPLELRLFCFLEQARGPWGEEDRLPERDLVELVYRKDWHALPAPEQARLLNRFRVVLHGLRDKLLAAKSGWRVERPGFDYLMLVGPGEPVPDQEAEAREAEAELAALMADVQSRGRPASPARPAPRPPTVEQCMEIIRTYLADGPKGSTDLEQRCSAQCCRPGTVRRAGSRLGLQRYRVGQGAGGRWLVRLPPSPKS